MGLLDIGAGAGKGLEAVMDRQMRQRAAIQSAAEFAERKRHALVAEQQAADNLALNSQYRQDALASLTETRTANAQNQRRDDIRARAGLRGAGDAVTPEEYDEELSTGMLPQSRYNLEEVYGGLDGDDSMESQPIIEKSITSKGPVIKPPTPGQPANSQQSDFVLNGKHVKGSYDPETQKYFYNGKDVTSQIADYDAPDRVWIDSDDPNNPGHTIRSPRAELPRSGVTAPLSPTQETELGDLNAIQPMMDRIDELLSTNTGQGVGPIEAPVAGVAHDLFGWDVTKEGPEGQELRSLLNQQGIEAAFARGGKTLTPTERSALQTFLAAANQDPKTIKQRWQQFKNTISAKLKTRQPNAPAGGGVNDDPGGLFGP